MSGNAIFQSHEQKTWNEFYLFVDTQLQSLRESKPDNDYQNLLKKLSAAGLTVAENKIIRHTEQKLDTSTEQNQPSFLETCEKLLNLLNNNPIDNQSKKDENLTSHSDNIEYINTKLEDLYEDLAMCTPLLQANATDLHPPATKPFHLKEYLLAEAYMLVEFFRKKMESNDAHETFNILLKIFHCRQLALAALKSTYEFSNAEYAKYLAEEYHRFAVYVNHYFLKNQNETKNSTDQNQHVDLVILAPLSTPNRDNKHTQQSISEDKTNFEANTHNTAIAPDEYKINIRKDVLNTAITDDQKRWNQSVTQLKNKSSSRHILVTAVAITAGIICLLLSSTPIGVPCGLGLAILGCAYLKYKYKPLAANNRNFMHADYANLNATEYTLDDGVRVRARNIIDNEVKISRSAKFNADSEFLPTYNQIKDYSTTKKSLVQQRKDLLKACQDNPSYGEEFRRAFDFERVIKVVKNDDPQDQPNINFLRNNRQKFFANPTSIVTDLNKQSIPVTARELCFRG